MLLNELSISDWFRRNKSGQPPANPAQKPTQEIDPRVKWKQDTDAELAKIKQQGQPEQKAKSKVGQAYSADWTVISPRDGKSFAPLSIGGEFRGTLKVAGEREGKQVVGKIVTFQQKSADLNSPESKVFMVKLDNGSSFMISMNPQSIAAPSSRYSSWIAQANSPEAQAKKAAQLKKQQEDEANKKKQLANRNTRERLRQAGKRQARKAVTPDSDFEARVQAAAQGRMESLIKQFEPQILEEGKKKKRKKRGGKFAKVTKFPRQGPFYGGYFGGYGWGAAPGDNSGGDGGGDGGGGGE